MLEELNTWAAKGAIVEAIASHPSAKAVTLAQLLGDLNRTASKISAHAGVPCFHTGFAWESGDQSVDYWIPQGLAGSATAWPDGAVGGKKVAVISWYYDPDLAGTPGLDKGARLAVVDTTDLAKAMYRLVLLVEPTGTAANPNLQAVKLHVGGLAWYKNWLYVADTTGGLRVFDWNKLLQVQTGKADALGKQADGFHAYNYKYVLPQVGFYKLCASSCCARFSFVEVDLSTSPPSLLTGEYSVDTVLGRLHRWPLDPQSGKLQSVASTVHASEVLFPGVVKMQGAQSWQGQYYLSSSAAKTSKPTSGGSLFRAAVGGGVKVHQWPHHPEDLHLAPVSGNLWSLTEDAGERAVFAVKYADLLAGCGN